MIRHPKRFQKILQDPSAIYETPEDVLKDDSLSKDEKRQVLNQWRYDAIQLQTGDAENMSGGEESPLDKILQCLRHLDRG